VAKEKEDTNYYQPIFKQNPISFMLRLCDDLQEWNRRYFVVSEESDIPVCSKCFTPSIARSNSKKAKVTYRCMCSSSEGKGDSQNTNTDYNSFRYYNFYNRKLYLVSTCDYMTSAIICKGDSNKKALCFHINYDYYRLLNVTRINPTYAKFRLSELNELKEVIKDQDYKSLFDFEYIYLDYFMTANPLTIKIKILEEFTSKVLESEIDSIKLESILDKLECSDGEKKSLETIMNTVVSSCNKKSNNKLFDFYKDLLKKSVNLRGSKKVVSKVANKFTDRWFSKCTSNYYKQIMKNLITETFEQYSKECTPDESLSSFDTKDFQNKYTKQYAPKKECDDALYNSVIAYCNSENDFNCYSENISKNNNVISMKYVSYFADLYFFETMNRFVQETYVSMA